MIREKTETIKLEETEIALLNKIGSTNCIGVDCADCDMFVPSGAHISSCYKSATNMLLKHIGRKNENTQRNNL